MSYCIYKQLVLLCLRGKGCAWRRQFSPRNFISGNLIPCMMVLIVLLLFRCPFQDNGIFIYTPGLTQRAPPFVNAPCMLSQLCTILLKPQNSSDTTLLPNGSRFKSKLDNCPFIGAIPLVRPLIGKLLWLLF